MDNEIDDEVERRYSAYVAASAESREILDRTAHIKVEPSDPMKEDVLERWQRQQPKPAPAPKQSAPSDHELVRQWQTYIDNRIETLMKAQEWRREAQTEAVGTALGQLRQSLRKEISDAVSALRADLTVASAHSNSVVDLPKFLKASRDAA